MGPYRRSIKSWSEALLFKFWLYARNLSSRADWALRQPLGQARAWRKGILYTTILDNNLSLLAVHRKSSVSIKIQKFNTETTSECYCHTQIGFL